jgi:hypothetical protein
MGRLAGRIHGEPAFQAPDGVVDAVLVQERPDQPIRDLADQPPETCAGHEQPILVLRLADAQPVQELPTKEIEASLQLAGIPAPGERLELGHVHAAGVRVQLHSIAPADDHVAAGLADLRQRLAEIVPRPLVAGPSPQQGREQLTGMGSAVLHGQVGEQSHGLPGCEVHGRAVGPARLERTEEIECERLRHDSGLYTPENRRSIDARTQPQLTPSAQNSAIPGRDFHNQQEKIDD